MARSHATPPDAHLDRAHRDRRDSRSSTASRQRTQVLARRARVGFRVVPRAFRSQDDDELRAAERTVTQALGDLPLDFQALLAVSNIFRAATAARAHLERTVLSEHRLSWSAFVTVFVLRVWGDLESRQLAEEVGVTPGTLSGVVDTLERRGFVKRAPHTSDGRRVVVKATTKGRKALDSIFVRFNEEEMFITKELSGAERAELARLLRRVLRTLDAADA
jgi:DNA-binding MarR family transcriptional regulator